MKRLKFLFASIVVVLTFMGLIACSTKEEVYTVTFEANGGTKVNPITAELIEYEPFTQKDDFTFEGWFITADFSSERVSFPYEAIPIRPGRQDERNLRVKGFPGFVYRVAA